MTKHRNVSRSEIDIFPTIIIQLNDCYLVIYTIQLFIKMVLVLIQR